MLLYFNKDDTLRLLEKKSGSELRYNRQIFFANDTLTKILKFVINISISGQRSDFIKSTEVDELTIYLALEKLACAGIPLSFWETWIDDFITTDISKYEKE